MGTPDNRTRVAVVGGGLAGLAAGCALAQAGVRVTLVERRPYLGGRASSYQHPGTGEVVDNCQHVLLGCCTNLIDLYRRTGTEDKIRWYEKLTFLEPGGRASVIEPSFLPAPAHAMPAFLGAACLTVADKVSIARALMAMLRRAPEDRGEPFSEWLRERKATPGAVERFWKPILISALNEDLERVSVPYAALVIRESFLKSAAAGKMGVPAIPLSDLYGAAGKTIAEAGGEVRLRATVESIEATTESVKVKVGGEEIEAEYVVLATPWDVAGKLFPAVENKSIGNPPSPEGEGWGTQSPVNPTNDASKFVSSPIVGIHLWFDREVTKLDHAVLLDRTIQWMFHKSRIHGRAGEPSYIELVVSSAKSLVDAGKNEIVELAVKELGEFFPRAREAKLVKSTVIKEVHATFSPSPAIDRYRPGAATVLPRVFLAGDWTATGWPATMEGAVRSGHLAAEAVAKAAGVAGSFLVPDLPAQGMMKLWDKR